MDFQTRNFRSDADFLNFNRKRIMEPVRNFSCSKFDWATWPVDTVPIAHLYPQLCFYRLRLLNTRLYATYSHHIWVMGDGCCRSARARECVGGHRRGVQSGVGELLLRRDAHAMAARLTQRRPLPPPLLPTCGAHLLCCCLTHSALERLVENRYRSLRKICAQTGTNARFAHRPDMCMC